MNKTVLGGVMIGILIYFLYKFFTETDENTAMFVPTAREVHIFCTASIQSEYFLVTKLRKY